MARAVVLSAVRTPVGRYGGGLAGVRPDDLAGIAIAAAVERAGIEPAEIEDVYLGCANQAGEDNRNVARMAALLAGLPESVAGVTVNRLCASGLSAVVGACHAIAAGDGDLFVAGGVESMSRAPLVTAKPDAAFPRGDRTLYDTTLGWRFPNPALEAMFPLEAMGETGENVAERWDVSREDQDAFAHRSQQRWAAADFADELVPVGERSTRDEHPRPETTVEKLGTLRPAFREGGTVTAGNSSGLNDGAAALVIASEEKARALGVEPLGAFVASAVAGVDPRVMGIGPVPAVRKLLDRAGIGVGDAGPRRAERGLRLAEPCGRARAGAGRGQGQRERRRDRDRPPARDERRATRRHPPARAAPPGRPLRRGDDVRRRRAGPGRALRAMRLTHRNTIIAAAALLGVLVIALSRGSEPSQQLQALRADTMATYVPPNGTLADTDSQNEGSALGKPVFARVGRLFELPAGTADAAFKAASDAAIASGWIEVTSSDPSVFLADKLLADGRAELGITLFLDARVLPDGVKPPVLRVSLRHLGP